MWGWGRRGLRREAMGRLEVIADTFLSMNAPVQIGSADLAGGTEGDSGADSGAGSGESRCGERSGVEVLRVEAGWSAVLRLPQMGREGEVAEMLLREAGVVVHPGSFYGIAEAGRVVVSLLGPAGVCGGFGAHRAWSKIEPW